MLINFTNSNIKDGAFHYTGSAKTSRFTSVMVRYVDKHEKHVEAKTSTKYANIFTWHDVIIKSK